jgi:hypothetical protein
MSINHTILSNHTYRIIYCGVSRDGKGNRSLWTKKNRCSFGYYVLENCFIHLSHLLVNWFTHVSRKVETNFTCFSSEVQNKLFIINIIHDYLYLYCKCVARKHHETRKFINQRRYFHTSSYSLMLQPNAGLNLPSHPVVSDSISGFHECRSLDRR